MAIKKMCLTHNLLAKQCLSGYKQIDVITQENVVENKEMDRQNW